MKIKIGKFEIYIEIQIFFFIFVIIMTYIIAVYGVR